MKGYLLIAITSITFIQGKAQDSAVPEIITDAIYSLRDSSKIFYIDSAFQFYGKFSRFAKAEKVKGVVDVRSGVKTSMRFSRKELIEIDDKFSRQKTIQWPADFLTNSNRMSNDSVISYTSYLRNSGFNKDQNYKFYYLFSQPVFVRNASVAIFRLAKMIDHSAGNDFVFIYFKEPLGWKRKMIIRSGAW